jgi:diguanylate cyclase (GGDEF)-like protein
VIVWWAPAEVAAEMRPEMARHVEPIGTPVDSALVAIVDTRATSVAEIIELRATTEVALVVCCEASEHADISPHLGDLDEISLIGEPLELVIDRARRVQRRAFPDRDPQTGLRSRRAFVQVVVDRAGDGSGAALLMFDIDHFKRVNDTHGHLVGDQVLRGVARRLAAGVGSIDALGRIGGEEIAALVIGSEAEAVEIAGRALAAVRERPIAGIEITASAGVAAAAPIEDLWRQADEALYAAKARGRDRAVSYNDLAREAASTGRDLDLESFESRTRILADKVADVIARRGRRLFEELKEQADIDALTGLYSRRYLDRRLELELESARERALPMAVALLDIDAFGDVNKTHGWPTGDRVLGDIAERIRATVRADDWVARYGGEEICVVMLGTDLDQAQIVLERVRVAIESTPFVTTGDRPLRITASLGAAALDGSAETVASLLERASARLLAAKAAGKNQVRV